MSDTANMLQKIVFPDSDFPVISASSSPYIVSEKAFHEEIEIKLFYEGTGYVMVNSSVYVARAGDIIIVNPYELHANINTDSFSGKYHLFIVSLDFLSSLLPPTVNLRHMLVDNDERFNHCIAGNQRLQAILLRIIDEMNEKKEFYKLIVKNLFCEFFALLVRDEMDLTGLSEGTGADDKNIKAISPALNKIHTSYADKLGIEELAALCNLSKYHFCRIFKSAMGMTAMEYLMHFRTRVAAAIIKNTDETIAKISLDCGFSDESYFYRCYKKIHGVSPKHLRK